MRRLSLAGNVLANAVGRGWTALLQIVATPIVVRFLGPEHFGFVGFAVGLTATVAFLDQAFSPVLARVLAMPEARSGEGGGAADHVRTFEAASWCCALLIGASILAAAPAIAAHLLAAGGPLTDAEKVRGVMLVGLWIAASWPGLLYASAFVGLERQDLLVAVRAILGTVGTGGGLLILWLVAPSLWLFLGWQAVASLMASIVLRVSLWRIVPGGRRAGRIKPGLLIRSRHFAGGNLMIGFAGVILMQAPGLIVARSRPLTDMAAYTLALLVGQQAASVLTQPVLATLMPRFVQLIASGDGPGFARAYHRWTALVVSLIVPVVACLVWFPREVLRVWLGPSSMLVEPVAALLPWMALGTLLNAVVTLPYIAQIASGWTRLSVLKNLVAGATLVPALLLLVPSYGPLAAAVAWLVLNACYYLVEVPLVHARLLRGELWSWWLRHTLLPIVAALGVGGLVRSFVSMSMPLMAGAAVAAASSLVSWLLLLALLPEARRDVAGLIRLLQGRLLRQA